MEGLRLESGKRYVRRDGEITGRLESNRNPVFRFKDPLTGRTYRSNGLTFIGSKAELPLDLVSVYLEISLEGKEIVPTTPDPVWA